MRRRNFLGAMGAAPGAAAQTSKPPASSQQNAAEPRVFFFDDGRHAAGLYQFEPPLTAADHVYTVDQLIRSGVDTYVYGATLEGGVAQYDSRVAQKWGDNVQKWKHVVWYRASRVLHQLIADGHDPLKLLIDRCHQNGIWFLASCYVNLAGGDRATHGGLGRKSDFVYDHPEFQVGPDSDPRARDLPADRFNFLHPELQRERFAVAEELLTRFETDGIELNLADPDLPFPFCRFSEAGKLAPELTEWMRRVKAAARAAEEAQGRRKRIYARIPAHPDTWPIAGYEVPRWVREGLVDGLICVSNDAEIMDQDLHLEAAVRLTRGHPCRVLASFSNTLMRQLKKYATPPMIWAAAASAYAQGADGFGLGDAHWTPNGWPWTSDEYSTLRLLGHPELLATADKHYHVRSAQQGAAPRRSWLPGAQRHLPRRLSAGETVELPLRVADDLASFQREQKLKSVRLQVRLTNFQPSGDRIRVELNGVPLPESSAEKNDLTYRLLDSAAASPYGYVFDYQLAPEQFPANGRNAIRVTLVQSDATLDLPREVYDVDCLVEYRPHRNFQQPPIRY